MELKEYLDYLVIWLQDVLKETKAKGFIVGLSGGIDSALVAALIKKQVIMC
jgi:NAD+ synthase